MAALGDTFRLASPRIDGHLHIIISDPIRNPGSIVTANFTTWYPDKDQSCIVEIGEHRQVTKRSCVDYRRERCRTMAQYDHAVATGLLVQHGPVGGALLGRILAGAGVSHLIPLGNRQILVDQGLIDSE
jgi:hypothetical protein